MLIMPSIRWEDHSLHIAGLVTELYKNAEFTDCILDTEGGLIHGHKAILAACSPYLKKLFLDHRGMKVVPCKDIQYFNMKHILDFIYFGEIEKSVSLDVVSLSEAANLLQIAALSVASQNFLVQFSSKANGKKLVANDGTPHCMNFTRRDLRDVSEQQNLESCSKYLQDDSEIIDKLLVGDCEVKARNVSKDLSKDWNDDRPQSMSIPNTSGNINDAISTEAEDLQNELIPISFVVVKSERVDSESDEVDDEQDVSCDPDSPLQSSPCNDDNKSLEYESQTTIEVKEEAHEDSDDMEGTKDIEMKFESICDFSKSDLQRGNPLYIGVDSGDIDGDINQRFWKEEIAKCEGEDHCLKGKPDIEARGLKREGTRESMKTTKITSLRQSGDTNAASSGADVECSHEVNLEQPLRCRACAKAFADRGSLHKHERTHTREKPFACGVCGAAFALRKYLKAHAKIHSYAKPFACGTCALAFAHKSLLERHLLTHAGVKPFPCSVCGACFRDKSNLRTHARTHTGEKPFRCAWCLKAFSQKCSLQKHERSHTGEKPFSCDACGKAFVNKGSLTSHMELHSNVRHPCALCTASFRQMNNLITHVRVQHGGKDTALEKHSGEPTPKVCDACGKTFDTDRALKKHARAHVTERPFACKQCAHAFRYRSHLAVHVRTHTGEKPYSCEECGVAFRQRGDLKKHSARAHIAAPGSLNL